MNLLAGIVSWGTGCGRGPQIYTKVSRFCTYTIQAIHWGKLPHSKWMNCCSCFIHFRTGQKCNKTSGRLNKGVFVLIKHQKTYYTDNYPLVISISSLNSILYKSPGIPLQGLAGPKSELPPSLFRLINTEKYREILGYTEKYWEILRNTEKYWEILKNTKKYWEIPPN